MKRECDEMVESSKGHVLQRVREDRGELEEEIRRARERSDKQSEGIDKRLISLERELRKEREERMLAEEKVGQIRVKEIVPLI